MTNKTTAEDMKRIRSCATAFVESAKSLPVSYVIGKKRYIGIPEEFLRDVEKKYIDSNIIEYVYKGLDPQTGIAFKAECLEYLDFPVVEWTFWLENTGCENTPVIKELYGMNGVLPGVDSKIICNNGDTCNDYYYTDKCVDLVKEQFYTEFPEGGRSCEDAIPYYRVLCKDFGYTLSIGWPGQWVSEFLIEENGFCFKAKQQYTNFYLKPGEKIRTPRMTIMTFEGDMERGINLWRRWMLSHVIPKTKGNLVSPFMSTRFCRMGFTGEEGINDIEEEQLRAIESIKESGIRFDNFWMDAGWYPCSKEIGWRGVGNWYADKKRYPNGLKNVGDKCHENDMLFLLWFEIERVSLKDTDLPDDYVLRLKDETILDRIKLAGFGRKLVDNMGLLNLGNPDCCNWITDHLDGLIKEYGIDIYRQDCNFPPLQWWLQNDDKDRLGITENLYIQGLLRCWDELCLRNPGLFINSVASGGRRSDLEILRRSVPLHQSDYGHGVHPIHQAMMAFSFTWQPFCGNFAMSWDNEDGDYTVPYNVPEELEQFDNFMAHNAFCPSIACFDVGFHCGELSTVEFQRTKEAQYYKTYREIWERAVPYTLEGDFYVLAMTDRTNKCWHAIQFHLEDKEEGIIQAIRNTKAPAESIRVYPRGVDASKTYLFESPEFDRRVTVSGQELLGNGFEITLPMRMGEIWFYREV